MILGQVSMQVNWLWRKENPEAFFEEIETNLCCIQELESECSLS